MTTRGGFRKAMTASERVKSFSDDSVASLVSTTEQYLKAVCEKVGIGIDKVELVRDDSAF